MQDENRRGLEAHVGDDQQEPERSATAATVRQIITIICRLAQDDTGDDATDELHEREEEKHVGHT